MISRFKFLTNNDEDELERSINNYDHQLASWMWANQNNLDENWVRDEVLVTGIRSFLMLFPEHMIIPVLSITGNNITMTIEDEHRGWPFDILGGTLLHIVYLRWIPE